MILLNTSLNLEVLTIEKNGQVVIHDTKLNKLMKKGIDIPAFLQQSYNNQSKVKLGDPLFIKAFKEVYWIKNMNCNTHKWVSL